MSEVVDERKGWTSASNALPDELCAGRHLASKGIVSHDTDNARFGREIHEALKTGDTSKLRSDQLDIFESIQEIQDRKLKEIFGDDLSKLVIKREERMWCRVKSGDNVYMHSGQLDFLGRMEMVGAVIEYKTLPGDQAGAAIHRQIRDQIILASRTLVIPKMYGLVIQPLVTHNPTWVLYDRADIDVAEIEMFNRVIASNDPKSLRVPGSVQCRFCKAKHLCVEYAKWSADSLPVPLHTLDIPAASWTPEQMAAFCAGKGIAKRWIEDNEKFIKELMGKDPNAVPGFKLEEGDERSTVTDPQELFNRFADLGGTLEQFMKCINVTKKDLSAALRVVTGKKGKGLNAETTKLLDGILEVKRNAPSIAKDT